MPIENIITTFSLGKGALDIFRETRALIKEFRKKTNSSDKTFDFWMKDFVHPFQQKITSCHEIYINVFLELEQNSELTFIQQTDLVRKIYYSSCIIRDDAQSNLKAAWLSSERPRAVTLYAQACDDYFYKEWSDNASSNLRGTLDRINRIKNEHKLDESYIKKRLPSKRKGYYDDYKIGDMEAEIKILSSMMLDSLKNRWSVVSDKYAELDFMWKQRTARLD